MFTDMKKEKRLQGKGSLFLFRTNSFVSQIHTFTSTNFVYKSITMKNIYITRQFIILFIRQ